MTNSQQVNQLYQSMDVENRISSATPEQIIVILLETSISKLKQAKIYIQRKNIERKGKLITKVINMLQAVLYADISISALHQQEAQLTVDCQGTIRDLFTVHMNNDIALLDKTIETLSEMLVKSQSVESVF